LQAGRDHRPGGDGPRVRAVDAEAVRRVHRKRFVSGGDSEGRDGAERMAWKRHLRDALDVGLIAGEEVDDKEMIWFVREGDSQ
jgi:hypothetical protein